MDLFVQIQTRVCEAIGEPDYRLHYVLDFSPKMIFGAALWRHDVNDLYLVQDAYDGHAGSGAFVDMRILPRRENPTKLPVESVFINE